MIKYKSTKIEFINNYTVSNLCAFDNYYYFQSDELIEEATQISDEEFQEILSRIVHVESKSEEVQPSQLDRIEETQLTQLMALADIYETIVAE